MEKERMERSFSKEPHTNIKEQNKEEYKNEEKKDTWIDEELSKEWSKQSEIEKFQWEEYTKPSEIKKPWIRKELPENLDTGELLFIRDCEKGQKFKVSSTPINDTEEIIQQVFELNYSSYYNIRKEKDFVFNFIGNKHYLRQKNNSKKDSRIETLARKRMKESKWMTTFGVERSSKGKIFLINDLKSETDKFTIQLEGDFIKPVSEDFKILVNNDVKGLLDCNLTVKSRKNQGGYHISGNFLLKPNITSLDSRPDRNNLDPYFNELDNAYQRCLRKYSEMFNEIVQAQNY